jgi:uncharacterized membrane protein
LQASAAAVEQSVLSIRKITQALRLQGAPKIRKIFIAVIGGTIVLIGIALLVLPGPAALVIPIGLVILASEFAWARRILRRGKTVVEKARRGKWRDLFFLAGGA